MVQFVLVAPEARNVVLVGDFNDWDPAATPLHRAPSGGAWTAALPLQPGRHRYAFVVDGVRWMADPTAPPAPDDDFGSPGSVVTVGA
jgi:1,4-alpha-glucan branching enzyme